MVKGFPDYAAFAIQKKILIAFCSIALMQSPTGAQTWKSPDYKPEPYRKVMVLAKVTETAAKRQLEDFSVKYLKDKGIDAIPAYSNVNAANVKSREAFLAIADSLQVDALLVYEVNGAEQRAEVKSTVSVGVGVGGMYGGYAGASVPIAVNTKKVMDVKLSVYFYNRASTDEQWANQLSGTVDGPTDKLANTFAKTTVKAMFQDGMFVTKK
jgi:hypothetical protein